MAARRYRRAERALADLLEPGEHVVTTGRCLTASTLDSLLSGKGLPVDVVLSDRAVYLAMPSTPTGRIPFAKLKGVIREDEPSPSDPLLALSLPRMFFRAFVLHLCDGRMIARLPPAGSDLVLRLRGSVGRSVF